MKRIFVLHCLLFLFVVLGGYITTSHQVQAYSCKQDYYCDIPDCDPPGMRERERCCDSGSCPAGYSGSCDDSNECGSCGSQVPCSGGPGPSYISVFSSVQTSETGGSMWRKTGSIACVGYEGVDITATVASSAFAGDWECNTALGGYIRFRPSVGATITINLNPAPGYSCDATTWLVRPPSGTNVLSGSGCVVTVVDLQHIPGVMTDAYSVGFMMGRDATPTPIPTEIPTATPTPLPISAFCRNPSTSLGPVIGGQSIVYNGGTSSVGWDRILRYGYGTDPGGGSICATNQPSCTVTADYALGATLWFWTNLITTIDGVQYTCRGVDSRWQPSPPNSNPQSICDNTCNIGVAVLSPPPTNYVPGCGTITVSGSVVQGSTVSLTAPGVDPDTNQTLTYNWTSTNCGGTFPNGSTTSYTSRVSAPRSSTNSPSTITYTLPTSNANCSISAIVSDGTSTRNCTGVLLNPSCPSVPIPMLGTPSDNTCTNAVTLTLSATGASIYQFLVDDENTFTTQWVRDSGWIASGTYSFNRTISPALTTNTYFWTARSRTSASCSGNVASPRILSIDVTAPLPPVTRRPTCYYDSTVNGVPYYSVRYSWNPVTDIGCGNINSAASFGTYWSQIAADASFNLVPSFPGWYNSWEQVLSRVSVSPSGIFPSGTTVYAHVRARDSLDNQSDWSTPTDAITLNSATCIGTPVDTPTPPVIPTNTPPPPPPPVSCNGANPPGRYSICGYVFYDLNSNGVREWWFVAPNTENDGFPDIDMQLSTGATTRSVFGGGLYDPAFRNMRFPRAGWYQFDNLAPGTYTVRRTEDPSDGPYITTNTNPRTAIVITNRDRTAVDFGLGPVEPSPTPPVLPPACASCDGTGNGCFDTSDLIPAMTVCINQLPPFTAACAHWDVDHSGTIDESDVNWCRNNCLCGPTSTPVMATPTIAVGVHPFCPI